MLPPVGPDLKAWAEDIRRWLARSWDALTYRQATSNATQDGLIMWDTAGYPVVSKGGAWVRVQQSVAAPATASSAGDPGDFAYDSGFLYICTSADTWKRVAVATW